MIRATEWMMVQRTFNKTGTFLGETGMQSKKEKVSSGLDF